MTKHVAALIACIALFTGFGASVSAQVFDTNVDWDASGLWSRTPPAEAPLPPGFFGQLYAQAGVRTSLLSIHYSLESDKPYAKPGLVAVLQTALSTGPTATSRVWFQLQGMDSYDNVAEGLETFRFSAPAWTPFLTALPLTDGMLALHANMQILQSDGKIVVAEPRLTMERNRLSNPNADDQPVTAHGWTALEGTWDGSSDATSKIYDPWRRGKRTFAAGRSPRAVLAQTVSLKPYAKWRDQPNPRALFFAQAATVNGSKDTAQMLIEALAADGSVIASRETGAAPLNLWWPFTLDLPIPDQATDIRIKLVANRVSGKENDVYFDNLALVFPGSGDVSGDIVLMENSAPQPKEDSFFADVRQFLKTQPVSEITMTNARWADKPLFDSSTPQLDGNRTLVWSYTPAGPETLTVTADNAPGAAMLVQVLDSRQRPVSALKDEYEFHVRADLDAGETYTILVTAKTFVFNGTTDLVAVAAPRTATALVAGTVRGGFLGNPIIMKQFYSGPANLKTWAGHFDFIALRPKIDGLPASVFKQPALKGEAVLIKTNLPGLIVEAYDGAYRRLDEPGSSPDQRIVRMKTSGDLWVLVLGPKGKYFRDFIIEFPGPRAGERAFKHGDTREALRTHNFRSWRELSASA